MGQTVFGLIPRTFLSEEPEEVRWPTIATGVTVERPLMSQWDENCVSHGVTLWSVTVCHGPELPWRAWIGS
jgi:hypothetical protein